MKGMIETISGIYVQSFQNCHPSVSTLSPWPQQPGIALWDLFSETYLGCGVPELALAHMVPVGQSFPGFKAAEAEAPFISAPLRLMALLCYWEAMKLYVPRL